MQAIGKYVLELNFQQNRQSLKSLNDQLYTICGLKHIGESINIKQPEQQSKVKDYTFAT